MANTGNVFPGTGENNAGIGATAWVNPGNCVSDNATDTTCTAAASSQYLVARNFNFASVPANATIAGIVVRIEASESSTGAETLNAKIQDDTAALVGDTKTNSINGTSKTVYTYGTTSDVWTSAPTGNKIHDADWGVRFWYTTAHNVAVDYVTMALEYTVPAHGIATETQTALAVAKLKIRAAGLATSSNTALALSRVTFKATGQSASTETVLALTPRKAAATGVGSSSNTSLAVAATKYAAMGQASASNAAIGPSAQKRTAPGIASETDTAIPLELDEGGQVVPVGRADAAESAQALTARKIVNAGLAAETDIAIARSIAKMIQFGLAIKTDTAFGLSTGAVQIVSIGMAFHYCKALRRPPIGGARRRSKGLRAKARNLLPP